MRKIQKERKVMRTNILTKKEGKEKKMEKLISRRVLIKEENEEEIKRSNEEVKNSREIKKVKKIRRRKRISIMEIKRKKIIMENRH